MHVFASCSSYALGCLVGMHEAKKLIIDAVADVEHEQLLPAVHALRTLRELADPLELRVDGGETQIAKCRSRHFDAALHSKADVWVTFDDDIDTDLSTLATLLAAVDCPEPRVCFGPYLQRGAENVALVSWPTVWNERDVNGGRVRTALNGGFGLVAVNRAAMQLIARDAPTFIDKRGEAPKSAAFLEVLTDDGYWLGEDFAFFERARRVATVEALVTGFVSHAGMPLHLEVLQQ